MNRRSFHAVITVSLLCLSAALSGVTAAGVAAASPASGIKGDPQPELKPFKIGTAKSGGSVALEPNGSFVTAFATGSRTTEVCLLNRGKHSCADKVTLTTLDGDNVFGIPQVFVPSANHVVVLVSACCDHSGEGDLLFSSTDGGKSFGAPVRVGSLVFTSAALIGKDIVATAMDDNGGAQVASIPVSASGPPASIATANSKEAFDAFVTNYHSGALIASDDLTSDYTTYVEFAASGSNFHSSTSYHKVSSLSHEQLMGLSGRALLTIHTRGKQTLELRLFNGKTFGAAHGVPGTSGGGPEAFTVDQDPSGRVHVFSERGLASKTFHLIEESTSNGTHWSSLDLGLAIQSNTFAVALDGHGSGLVLGTQPAWGYPVLAGQSVTFTLKSSTIKKGRSTTGSGKGSPAGAGRTVQLQVERKGKWFTVATTHEKSGGSFSFKIKGSSTGSFRYRAVASDLAGYLLFGYSPARSLKVHS